MVRRIILSLFLVVAGIIIWYLSNRICSHDLRFYYGKDNGYFIRVESICILSSIFWIIMSDYSRIKSKIMLIITGVFLSITGFIVGAFSSIISYLIMTGISNDNCKTQVIFHILACLIFMTIFYLINRWRNKKTVMDTK
ncbi:hypothetical protein HNP38_000335 [Chryseobacterium defluvii]|uniref:Uncharacterized protein n=1 Tax=Chryseobacterium defluvii TaxID=160396 RepID=A0A840KC06_9FLAO|nr:hypothetical protein [Chryseobacterium defluvii]